MLSKSRTAIVLSLLFFAGAAVAQEEEDFDARRADVDKKIAKQLVAFGRRATGQKQSSQARVAYQILLDHYNEDHATARKGLGFRKIRGEWRAGAVKLGVDVPDQAKAARIQREWERTRKAISKLHGDFGMALHAAGHMSRAFYQLERALEFRPGVREWHLALGHVEANGFFGTEEQVDFVKKFTEIRNKASELAAKEYEVSVVPQSKLPASLRKSGLDFYGARSKHFTHWVVDSQDDALNTVQWAERSFALARVLAGNDMPRGSESWSKYYAILRTREQHDQLLRNSPETRGKYTLEQAKLFGGSGFQDGGNRAHFSHHHRDNDGDMVTGHVVKRHVVAGCNDGFGEGVVHAMTWLMVGTIKSSFTSLQHTVTEDHKPLRKLPDAWRSRLMDEIAAGKDWRLEQIPRERIHSFRDSARVKSWSFVLFMMARFPRQWLDVVRKMPKVDGLTVEDVAKTLKEILNCSVGELEAEWREWARQGSPIGRATDW
tara:strand:+ start:47121 stop:48590 length:1470 start_codon:yes stop_codon:yes gene_type:complete